MNVTGVKAPCARASQKVDGSNLPFRNNNKGWHSYYLQFTFTEMKQKFGNLTWSYKRLVCLWASKIHERKTFPIQSLTFRVPKDFYFNSLNCPSVSKLIVFSAKRRQLQLGLPLGLCSQCIFCKWLDCLLRGVGKDVLDRGYTLQSN